MTLKEVKQLFKTMTCLACGKSPVDVAHIKTVGSGGPMELWNLLPLCRQHHALSHQIGWIRFGIIYPTVRRALEMRGWKIEKIGNIHKYRRSDENEF